MLNAHIESIKTQFETLTLASVPALAALYASDAHFKDPFNAVQGRDKVAHIFDHMFAQVESPRFVVTKTIVDSSNTRDVFLLWDFHFIRQSQAQTIVGATHLELNESGLIQVHTDYWDAAEQVYETVPVLGSVLRWIKRKIVA